jgi:hypothetical protein
LVLIPARELEAAVAASVGRRLGISTMVRGASVGAIFGHRKRFGAFLKAAFGTGSKTRMLEKQ